MLSLTRFLQQQAEAQNDGECDTQVEQLVQRVSEAVLIGDRREALQHLRDLLASSAKAQLAFGAVGFPAMLQVVREREDLEMVQLALESLAAAVGGGGSGAGDASGGQVSGQGLRCRASPSFLEGVASNIYSSSATQWLALPATNVAETLRCLLAARPQAAAINAQQLVRTPEGLPLLLSLLGQEPAGLGDFYARYHTLQVLKGLVATAPHQLQEVRGWLCWCAAGSGYIRQICSAMGFWGQLAALEHEKQQYQPHAAPGSHTPFALPFPPLSTLAGHPGRPPGRDPPDGPAGRAGGAAQ